MCHNVCRDVSSGDVQIASFRMVFWLKRTQGDSRNGHLVRNEPTRPIEHTVEMRNEPTALIASGVRNEPTAFHSLSLYSGGRVGVRGRSDKRRGKAECGLRNDGGADSCFRLSIVPPGSAPHPNPLPCVQGR